MRINNYPLGIGEPYCIYKYVVWWSVQESAGARETDLEFPLFMYRWRSNARLFEALLRIASWYLRLGFCGRCRGINFLLKFLMCMISDML
jgi:hypothetical protein